MTAIDWKSNTNFYHVVSTDNLILECELMYHYILKGMMKIYFACFIAFLNSAINGYDLSLFGGLVALKSFQISFNGGHPFDENPNVCIMS
jgi:hypothetical protein